MEKITLLYILGTGSRWADNELRYSLRSVQKYLGDVEIVVCGENPKWLTNVTHIHAKDQHENKLNNAIHKIEVACKSGAIGERFVLMNDDFFFLRPHDTIPIYTLGKMTEGIRMHKTHRGYYYDAMKRTLVMLINEGIDAPESYEVHYPMTMETAAVMGMIKEFHTRRPYLFRSLYGNLFNVGGEERQDTKVYKAGELRRGFADGLDLVSTHDPVVLRPFAREWLKERFPEVSKYENDCGKGVEIWDEAHKPTPRFTTQKGFFWAGRQYNAGDIIRYDIPMAIVKKNGLVDLNADS